MHRRFGFCTTMLALAALSGPARAAPPFVEISAALAAGNGAAVLALADTGLREPGISSADRARLLMDRGFADQLLAQADNALTDLTQAIEIHGMTDLEQSRAYMERGIVLDGMGRIDDAIGDYSAVLRLDPSSLAALSNRARAYWRGNHFEEARQDFLASLAANNPAPEYSYYGLGQVAESEGKPEEAKDFYAKAVAADPHYSQAADRLAALGALAAKQAAMSPPSGKMIAQAAPLAPAATAAAAASPSPATKSVTAQDAPAAKASPPPGAIKTATPPTSVTSAPEDAVPQVQLGAWRYQAQAETGWQRTVKKADGALAGLVPHIVIADVPGQGRYYRLRVETAKGRELCALLTAKGMACTLVRPAPSGLAKVAAPPPELAANEPHKR
jgi:tetratricopeptide (TPR) repeat protein